MAADGDADGDGPAATAGAAQPSTAMAARAAALRRSVMIGGASPCGEPGGTGRPRAARLRVPRRCRAPAESRAREPVTIPSEFGDLAKGRRRNCTGFPPYGCDDDLVTLPVRRGEPERRL
ncbi:hypothetical protein GCM10010129_08560 [Streptomyces fumigatiscleroticus]|nr:hypothetical protein GCM10010129_08560 [Streptomyces fumigatiscleroticus]